ncbi:MAG: rhomboid family intramembrane serine protease [Gammaproteobacteria bacterium]
MSAKSSSAAPPGDPLAAHGARATAALVALGTWAALWQFVSGADAAARAAYAFGVVPSVLTLRARLPLELDLLPAPLTLLTAVFPQAGLLPATAALLMLVLYGPHVEGALGWRRYLVFYFGCAILAALAEVLAAPGGRFPVIGAGGAVSGVVVASLLLLPRRRIALPAGTGIATGVLAATWFVFAVFAAPGSAATRPGLGWPACVGGALGGIILVLFLKRREVPLLAAERPSRR